MGPLIWNLYCGEAAEILPLQVKGAQEEVICKGMRKEVKDRWKLGNVYQYADDIMIMIKGLTIESVKSKASDAYSIMQNWFLRNRLKLNSQKTNFMFVMTRQRAVGKNCHVSVQFGNDDVLPATSEKILGVTFENNMSVNSHLTVGDSSLLQQVSRKMRALWLLRNHLSFKSRKMTAWGIVMSKLLYGIEVWGPCMTDKQLNQLQVIQNSVMRWTCAARRLTRTKDLLRMTGMMSMRQLIMYRVLICGLSAQWTGTPEGMLHWREATSRRLQTTSRSFRFFFSKMVAQLPNSLLSKDPKKSKGEIKEWILHNMAWKLMKLQLMKMMMRTELLYIFNLIGDQASCFCMCKVSFN